MAYRSRFSSSGASDQRVCIQQISLAFQKKGSSLYIFFITKIDKLRREWPMNLKCLVMNYSRCLFLMSNRWPFLFLCGGHSLYLLHTCNVLHIWYIWSHRPCWSSSSHPKLLYSALSQLVSFYIYLLLYYVNTFCNMVDSYGNFPSMVVASLPVQKFLKWGVRATIHHQGRVSNGTTERMQNIRS